VTADAPVQAELKQMNGLSLIIQPCAAGRAGCMRVCLSGTALQAAAYVASIASSPDSRTCWQYFKAVARIEGEQTYHWLSECQDLNFSASTDSAFPDQILLSVHLGSTRDDDCDWQINGTLLLSYQQVDDFAEALKGLAL
jgi:hypothetical protein